MLDKQDPTEDYIPPFAPPLTGDEGIVKATWTFMKNPLEGFGPLCYRQPIVSVKALRTKIHTVTDPVGMNEVLKTKVADFRKSPLSDRIMKPATKEGLLVVHGEQWRRQRRGVSPMFAPRHMARLAPMVTEALDEFADNINAVIEAGGGRIELREAMADLTFDILAKSVLGNPKGMEKGKLKQAMAVALDVAGTIRPSDLLTLPNWMPRPIGPRGLRALKTIRDAADALLAQRDPDNPGDDLVGLLVSTHDPKTGQGLSVREQRDNLIGFFIAGHETTALTLTWALYLIGNHKQTEARIVEEVRAVAGDGPVQYEHIEKLTFTRAVIDETMRLYPPAPMMGREAVNDTQICGRDIAKGDIVLLATYVMHRTPRLWDKPNVFDPDRFLRDPELNRGKGKFMPFGAGPRVCVGAAFAVMEAVMALATLVRDYEIKPNPNCHPKLKMKITLRPDCDIVASVKRR
ncbi:MAG: cytochrome P450 [Robiginitomaculum sp.]|nr:cytochrome P450 [Robiginitomaculum sp.]